MRFSREELVGSAFIALGITLFVGFFYAAIVSKLLPPYENQLLAAIQNDWFMDHLVVSLMVLLLTCALDTSCDNCGCLSALAEHEDVQTCMK
ncbi:hypothetical protein EJB05_39096 [Eragrostis curvula]|uniref:Uncharacterized protein n=1 Tax=Eragrostis curvula TaxID=38414 RepID=A0A5J9TXL4_9POAL|nr:hypothetical protein EJB05_39096 [Eragrostis curvula]